MAIVSVTLLVIVLLWIVWKIYNHEKSRLQLFNLVQQHHNAISVMATDIVRIKRSFNTAQAQAFSNTVCESCKELLPENTQRTHDGHLYCVNCKAKHFGAS